MPLTAVDFYILTLYNHPHEVVLEEYKNSQENARVHFVSASETNRARPELNSSEVLQRLCF